jgi:hypothetical protein
MSESQEISGPELATSGVPEGWVIVGRVPDRDAYVIAEDTPVRHAMARLASIRDLISSVLGELNGVKHEGHW